MAALAVVCQRVVFSEAALEGRDDARQDARAEEFDRAFQEAGSAPPSRRSSSDDAGAR